MFCSLKLLQTNPDFDSLLMQTQEFDGGVQLCPVMPASFSNPNPSGLRNLLGRFRGQDPRDGIRGSLEDGRFQPGAELPLPMVDCRSAKRLPLLRVTNSPGKTQRPIRGTQGGLRRSALPEMSEKRTLTHKDVKNEGRSDYVYENKAHTTKCHAKNAAFYTKMHL